MKRDRFVVPSLFGPARPGERPPGRPSPVSVNVAIEMSLGCSSTFTGHGAPVDDIPTQSVSTFSFHGLWSTVDAARLNLLSRADVCRGTVLCAHVSSALQDPSSLPSSRSLPVVSSPLRYYHCPPRRQRAVDQTARSIFAIWSAATNVEFFTGNESRPRVPHQPYHPFFFPLIVSFLSVNHSAEWASNSGRFVAVATTQHPVAASEAGRIPYARQGSARTSLRISLPHPQSRHSSVVGIDARKRNAALAVSSAALRKFSVVR